jgi:hypothetical protein
VYKHVFGQKDFGVPSSTGERNGYHHKQQQQQQNQHHRQAHDGSVDHRDARDPLDRAAHAARVDEHGP